MWYYVVKNPLWVLDIFSGGATMDELNYKSAYLYLVGAVDDVIRYMEQMHRAAVRATELATLRQALAEAEVRTMSTHYAAL